MRLTRPQLTTAGDQVRYSVQVQAEDGPAQLWFGVAQAHADLLSDRADAAALALLIPAMARGQDLIIDGTLSQRLYYNLRGPVQKILQLVIPSLRRIRVEADDVQAATARPAGVACGFSGGIDSYYVLAEHHYGNPPPGYRLTHLLYNNVGAHGKLAHTIFPTYYARLSKTTAQLGLPFIAVDSNLADFYKSFTFQQTHVLRNLAVPLVLQGGLGRFFYAATFDYSTIRVKPSDDLAYADPVLIPCLGTESLDTLVVGCDVSRIEKTAHVAGIPDSYHTLDICVAPQYRMLADGAVAAANCSRCWKCRRTLLALEILGALDRYAGVFDLEIYRRERTWYMAEVLNSDRPLLREIVNYAKAHGYVFPWRARLAAALRLHKVADSTVAVRGLARKARYRLRPSARRL